MSRYVDQVSAFQLIWLQNIAAVGTATAAPQRNLPWPGLLSISLPQVTDLKSQTTMLYPWCLCTRIKNAISYEYSAAL